MNLDPDLRNCIEVQMEGISDNAMKLSMQIPRPVRYLGEDVEGLPAIKINYHLNEIRRILYSAGFNMNIEDIVGQLKIWDNCYHNGEAAVEDYEYDALKRALRECDPENSYLTEVGAEVRTGKQKLPVPMGSLDQHHDQNEIDNWVKRYSLQNQLFVVCEKLDGYSCLLEYVDGVLNNAYSRGNGLEGASILRHAKHIKSIPQKVTVGSPMFVRGEIIMRNDVFAAKYNVEFRNPRNMVAGCLNRTVTSPDVLADFDFIAHELIQHTTNPWGKAAAFNVLEFTLSAVDPFKTPNYVVTNDIRHETLINYINNFKKQSPYDLDGVVGTADDWFNVEKLSKSSSLNPEYSFKYKLDNLESALRTTVVKVHWEASKNNLLKPTVEIKPVHLNGVTITFATGNNARFIVENGIGPGTEVEIIRSGDVIPKITKIITPGEGSLPTDVEWEWTQNDKGEKVEIALKDKDTVEVRFKQVLDFFESLKVDQLKEASLQKLFDAFDLDEQTYTEILETIFDLTEIECQKVLGANGNKIYKSLHRRLETLTLPIIFGSLNFFGPGIGIRKFEKLFEQVSLDALMIMTASDIAKLDGFDIKTAQAIENGLVRAGRFLYRNKNWIKFQQEAPKTEELSTLNVVMTGFRDADLEKKIAQLGGRVSSGVSGKTSHLIADGKSLAEGSTKVDKARQLGVAVMSRDQFLEAFNL